MRSASDVFLDCKSQFEVNQRIGDYLIRLKAAGVLVAKVGKIKYHPIDGVSFHEWIFMTRTTGTFVWRTTHFNYKRGIVR